MKKHYRLGLLFLASAPLTFGAPYSSRMSANPAKVVSASYLGSPGNEWLSAGGFLANGHVLVCGISLEPEVTLLGKKATVWGKDQKAFPSISKWKKLGQLDTGIMKAAEVKDLEGSADSFDLGSGGLMELDAPKTEQEKKKEKFENIKKIRSVPRGYQWGTEDASGANAIKYIKLHWYMPEATAFLAVFDSNLKEMKTLRRFPRGAGSITDAIVAKDGSVYIAGAATDRIKFFKKPMRTETVPNPPGATDSTGGARHTYLAKLSPDSTKVEWLIELKGWAIPPTLTELNDGNIVMHGPGLRTYTPTGKLVRHVPVKNDRVMSGLSVNPLDASYIAVGDWMSPTGREPYRSPRCAVMNADGSLKLELFQWRGPFAGIDYYRLVADSAVRKAHFDRDGNYFGGTWSHGGNNVMFRYPYDIERRMPNPLKYLTSETCAVLFKLDTELDVVNAMHWKGTSIRDGFSTVDGSPVIMGGGRRGTDLLPNTLSTATANGQSMFIADPNLDAVRFDSAMPNCGTKVVSSGCYQRPDGFHFATGMSNGRPMLMMLTSVNPDDPEGKVPNPGLKNQLQGKHAGGLSDGYLVLLDLTADKPFKPYSPEPRKKNRKPKDVELIWPEEFSDFKMGAESHKNAQIVFRDEKEEYWPSFFMGRPELRGKFTYVEEAEPFARFIVTGNQAVLAQGDNSKRVLGELIKFRETTVQTKKCPKTRSEFMNPVQIEVMSSGKWVRDEDPFASRQWGGVQSPKCTTTVSGVLRVGDRSVEFKDAPMFACFRSPKTAPPGGEKKANHALLQINLTVKGKDIGLTGELADENIKVKSNFSAYSELVPSHGW